MTPHGSPARLVIFRRWPGEEVVDDRIAAHRGGTVTGPPLAVVNGRIRRGGNQVGGPAGPDGGRAPTTRRGRPRPAL